VKQILFFSNNIHKIKEVIKFLEYKKIKLLTLNDFPKIIPPLETGSTFKQNALIKSRFGFEKYNIISFADDSGICINALNKKPGVRSKRFIKENGGIKKSFNLIINEAKRKNDFKAFFQTTIALTVNKNKTIFFHGIIDGKISKKPIGNKGFGYDPIFIPNGSNKTFSQMQIQEKNKISHRAIALKKFKNYLIKKAFPSFI